MRRLLPAALALLMSAPGLALAQSDATCVAYMEADDAFQQAMEQAPEYPEFLAAQSQADEARKQADKALRKADRTGSDVAKIKALNVAISANEAAQKAVESLIAMRGKLLAALEPANDRRTKAHMAAYKGPVSDNPRVMAKLIFADVQRCHRRFE